LKLHTLLLFVQQFPERLLQYWAFDSMAYRCCARRVKIWKMDK
jgi:hypothetical protein